MSAPIFAATLRDHGLMVEPRPLGAVSTGLHLIEDARPNPALIAALTRMLRNTLCRRCDDAPESIRTCKACCAELAAERWYADEDDDVDVWRESGVDEHTGGTYRERWTW